MKNQTHKHMKFFKILIVTFTLTTFTATAQTTNSKSEIEAISETLMHYIEGTASGEPERVKKAFHPDLNLYSVAGDSLRVWYGQDYVGGIKEGRKSSRDGRIVSIDFENNAAMAKVEIVIPNRRIFTDYFLLLKYQGTWKIIHKSYTSVPYSTKK